MRKSFRFLQRMKQSNLILNMCGNSRTILLQIMQCYGVLENVLEKRLKLEEL